MPRSDIRFLLGFEPMRLADVDPNRTVLEWLREDQGLTGTKEGCAEGDCGACTVVLADDQDGSLVYRAVNACILFLPQLDGRQLITVEHLKDEDGRLHPIQQALVDHHASQCGFCTPGFVMSLLALAKDGGGAAASDREREIVCDALAGNLCRCTGYRPILDAASEALADGASERRLDDVFTRREGETIKALQALDLSEELIIESHGRRYHAPASLANLAAACAPGRARLLAGGTDMGLWVTKQHRDLDDIIDVTRVPELTRIEVTETHLVIGAGCTYRQLHEILGDHWPDFGALIRRIGGAQVRAAGTIGGNIANGSPIGDTMPALIALDARLILQRGQERREMPLEDLYLGYRETALQPGEFISGISIPTSSCDFRCYKISKRFDQDISAVLGAFALKRSDGGHVENIRIGLGGMAAVPKRAVRTEQAMIGKPWDQATVDAGRSALALEFQPISDMRASASYRVAVAQNLLQKLLIETSEPQAATCLDTAS